MEEVNPNKPTFSCRRRGHFKWKHQYSSQSLRVQIKAACFVSWHQEKYSNQVLKCVCVKGSSWIFELLKISLHPSHGIFPQSHRDTIFFTLIFTSGRFFLTESHAAFSLGYKIPNVCLLDNSRTSKTKRIQHQIRISYPIEQSLIQSGVFLPCGGSYSLINSHQWFSQLYKIATGAVKGTKHRLLAWSV